MKKFLALIIALVTMLVMIPMPIEAVSNKDDVVIGTAIRRALLTSDNCTILYEEVSEMKLVDVIAYDVEWEQPDQRILVFKDEQDNTVEVVVPEQQCMSEDYFGDDCKSYEIGRITCFSYWDFVVIGYANGNVKMYYEEN